jgi:hypothetical protein
MEVKLLTRRGRKKEKDWEGGVHHRTERMEGAGFEMETVDSREKKRTEKNRRDGDYEWIHGKGG